jgi:hypothetical protein
MFIVYNDLGESKLLWKNENKKYPNMIIVIHIYGDMIYVGDVQLVCFKTWVACKVCNHKDKGQGVMMLIKTFWLMCGEVKKKLSTRLNIGRMKVNYINFFLL